jgi:cell wall-associated NlpC family hydrolase
MPRTPSAYRAALSTVTPPPARLLGLLALLLGVLVATLATSATAAYAAPHRATHHARHHHHHHAGAHHHRHHAHRHHHSALGRSAGRVAHAMGIAVAQRGKPYAYGAAGPGAFDCSGLTSFAYHRAGFRGMPRTAAAQAGFVRHIPRNRMHRGDLIFFNSGGPVYHVGLYAGFTHGRRWVLHAPYPGQRVHPEPLWTNAWFAGTLRYR